MIDFKDISVVVQGAVDFSMIDQVLLSVRTVLPEAEIILSTWEGVDYTAINVQHYDKLILSQDPGGFSPRLKKNPNYLNNVDRQIRSSYNGMAQATKPYCLKMRTDMVLTHSQFLQYFEKYNQYQTDYKLVKSRMLNNASGATDPFWNHPLHPADFFVFGYTEDVKTFFSAPLFPEVDKSFQHNQTHILAKMLFKRDGQLFGNKCHPEIYLMTTFIQKYHSDFKGFENYELSPQSVATAYAYLVNNFVMLSDKQLGIQNLKHPHHETLHYPRSFNNLKWQKIYKLLCHPAHAIVKEESENVAIIFSGWVHRGLLNNRLDWVFLLQIKITLWLLKKRWYINKKRTEAKGLSFPQGSEVHDVAMIKTIQSIAERMFADKDLLKGLEPFTDLDKKLK
jgi:hypothetical protein